MVNTVYLNAVVMLYGIIALSHLFIQMSLSHAGNYLIKREYGKYTPSVAIIIPCYNEAPELFHNCVMSALNSDYTGELKVFAVDDGSKNKKIFEAVDKIKSDKLDVIHLTPNAGKRKAQKVAFDVIGTSFDVIVTLDSDTILKTDAIRNIVKPLENKHIGAVTGYADVINRNQNILTRLICSRYWLAFNLERGAQSLFNNVLCCTGVISAYRNDVIQSVKTAYVTQMFANKECTYGDDRHLTNLVLDKGYGTVYEKTAIGYTEVPHTMKKYLKQQLRWNRSFYRELLVTLGMIRRNPNQYSLYTFYDLAIQTIMPVALMLSVAYMVYRSIYLSPVYIIAFLGTLIGIGLLRSIYAMSITRDKNFLIFPTYAFIHLFLLIPLRLYALFTIQDGRWGTR